MTYSTSGSQLTIKQTTPFAYINWQQFNIAAGETTTFDASANSVTWNYINDPTAPSRSTIDGTLTANGYVVLQNPNGFYVGGQASITAHGLIMTTASTPALNLSSGGPWEFDTPPPNIKIENYGRINITGGGSVYLIADEIVNGNDPSKGIGTISAPGGKIGLYAGKTVLVSTAPDGRGLSAQVTLPQGSVNNDGKLVADAGSIVLQAAQIVNQDGLIQANSAKDVNGTIELVASDSVSLGANSAIAAKGDTTGISPGGSVTIQAGNSFSDENGSTINVAGGLQGGDGGQVAISAPQMSALNSSISGQSLSIDTADIILNADGSPMAGALALNVNSFSAGLSQINLQADNDIEVSALWNLTPKNGIPSALSLLAGNTVTVDSGAGMEADGGKITLSATTVNQNGTLQANSLQSANGAIEIDAGDAANLGADSIISVNGDSTAAIPSAGGSVNIQAGNSFSDQSGSAINVAGAAQGGNGGQVTISAPQMNALNSSINGKAAANYADASLSIDTADIALNADGSPVAGALALNVNSLSSGLSHINLQAANNIELSSLWNLAPKSGVFGELSLLAGNNITVDNGAGIEADAGKIAISATTLNLNGLVQANSIGNVNGDIELTAGDPADASDPVNTSAAINLGANSLISAKGDATGVSAGGSVSIQSGNSFSDQSGSAINVAGGAQGGKGGQVTISAPQMSAIHSSIDGSAAANYADASLSIDTADITLNADGSPVGGALALDASSLSSGLSQINLQAANNIEVSSLWGLTPKIGVLGTLSLLAGNMIAVDNGAGIEADAGRIAMSAPTVNVNGSVQANSVGNANGAIEIYASGSGASLSLGANSLISANGNPSSTSPGGFVILKSDNSFIGVSGSRISVLGNAGGQNGIIEIFGKNVTGLGSINSTIVGESGGGNGYYALLFNPDNLTLSSSATSTSSSNPNLYINDLLPYSQICLYNIVLNLALSLNPVSTPTALNLFAGNDITLKNSLVAGNYWTINLTAGTLPLSSAPLAGNDGIYLNGSSFIQTQDGDINLYAPNEVIIGSGAIRTLHGGNINVTTEYGDVNTGTSTKGFNFSNLSGTAPYYSPFTFSGVTGLPTTSSQLGGISTAGGGNVTITAGGNVTSYLPTGTESSLSPNNYDAGTGAFGSQPGNVTITAGGNVYGHYVLVNGTGTINAGQNIGTVVNNVALSLVSGTWNLNAPNGNIYLQEVRNPNGVFDSLGGASQHLFDYDPTATVNLTAGDGVYLTGQNIPRPFGAVPLILPPTLNISAGSGGVVLQVPTAAGLSSSFLDQDITLFPSPDGNLQIVTTDGGSFNGNNATLLMSDSAQTQWSLSNNGGPQPFSESDHGSVPTELNNYDPVIINIAGNMNNVKLQTSKETWITAGGDMTGCSFYGQNLHSGDVTSITVGGWIYNAGSFNFVVLNDGIPDLLQLSQQDLSGGESYLPPNTADFWYDILQLAVNPNSPYLKIPVGTSPQDYNSQYVKYARLAGSVPGFVPTTQFYYDPATKKLTYIGTMTDAIKAALDQSELTVVVYGPDGIPETAGTYTDPATGKSYYLVKTATIPWVPSTTIVNWDGSATTDNQIDDLYAASQGAPSLGSGSGAYFVGGTGQFDVKAGSMSLGNSFGIISLGNGNLKGKDYSSLTPYITSGATITVKVAGNLEMPSSTIATLGGGNVTVTSLNGSMDLGSQDWLPFEPRIINATHIGTGIYATGPGDVKVTAYGDINIDSSRIATFDGGDITIESLTGDVDAGSGGAVSIPINYFSPNYSGHEPVETFPANGIVAGTLTIGSPIPGAASLPGNITVTTPRGSIYADLGGILQAAFGETLTASGSGPTINLSAGSPGYVGDIVLGNSGVIGINVNATATGKITGLVISQQNANINAAQDFAGTVFSGGTATLSAGGAITGTIIGIGGVNASGGGGVTATLLGQNVSVNGGAAQSTLATSSTATSASQSAAGQASDENQQQVASNSNEEEKKKKKKKDELVRSVGRVTVILPRAS